MGSDRFTEQARELVAKMTLEERASMLRYDAPAIPRLGIPAYNWWNEALHGVARAGTATVFPQAIGMAASFDRALIRRMGEIIATEGRAKYNAQSARGDRDIYKGLTFWSPNVNIFRDPRWGRGHETYGEDPYLTGELGAQFVEALQEKDEKGYMKAAACAKHFAVHSGPEGRRHEFNAVVSAKDFRETYLPAFEKLVREAGVEGVMGAYNRVYGEPCCGSKLLLRDILRGEWGFDGYVTSDCWAIADFHEHHRVTDNVLESVALALNNGCDLNCGASYPHAVAACERGLVSEETITECCERVMRTRLRLGLFDPDCSFNQIGYGAVCCPEHISAALDAARESFVLLKNDGILPLKGVRSLGVIGPNAANPMALIANYHGTPDREDTPLNALGAEADRAGFRLHYSLGCPLARAKAEDLAMENDRFAEALAVADESDAVVLFLGMDETIEGEEQAPESGCPGDDKDSLRLPGRQQELLEALCETGKPVVLVLNVRQFDGPALRRRTHCAAILQAWYPGARGGTAIADVLFGRVSPVRQAARDLLPLDRRFAAVRRLRHGQPHLSLLSGRGAVPVRLRPRLRRHPPRRRGAVRRRRNGDRARDQPLGRRRRGSRAGLRPRSGKPLRAAPSRAVRLRARLPRARRIARSARAAGQIRPHRDRRFRPPRARQRESTPSSAASASPTPAAKR